MDQTNVALISCPDCAFQMPETASYCPGCGRPMLKEGRAEGGTHGRVGVFPESIAGALAYFTFIPAILFLVLNPYNKNPFVRFHSVHCLLFWGAGILITLTLKLASLVLFIIPVLGPLLVVLVSVVAGLAAVMIWLVLVIKALQGEMFKIPVLGEFAEHYAEPL